MDQRLAFVSFIVLIVRSSFSPTVWIISCIYPPILILKSYFSVLNILGLRKEMFDGSGQKTMETKKTPSFSFFLLILFYF